MKRGTMVTRDMPEATLPHNREAEESLLGALLYGGNVSRMAIEQLKPEDFYLGRHQTIFRHILQLFADEGVIETVLLVDLLEKEEQLEEAGGRDYIQELPKRVRTSGNALEYAHIIKEASRRRNVINVCHEIEKRARVGKENSANLIDEAGAEVLRLAEGTDRKHVHTMKKSLEEVFNLVDQREKGEAPGVLTGFKRLDELTSGLQQTDLVIIAGRPAMGKTTFSLNVALNAAFRNQIPVAVFSLEMSYDQIAASMLCNASGVAADRLYKNKLTDQDWDRLIATSTQLSNAPIFIDDSPGLNAMSIRSRARMMHNKHNLGLIVIDYLQLLEMGSGRTENRQQEISQISRSLKQLARELKVPVVTLSQLSRAVESRDNHRPRMSDLRESGAIEQDADLIMLLYREEYYQPEKEDAKGMAEVIVAKHRKGQTDNIPLAFRGETLTFANPSLPSDAF